MKRHSLCTASAFGLLLTLLAVMLIANAATGSVRISCGQILRILFKGDRTDTTAVNVILKIRLPRLLAAALLGGALSVSGFLLQTFFRNPISGPYVLGVSSGAKLFVSLAMVFGLRAWKRMPFSVMMAAAFAGSLLCTGLVLVFARHVRSMSVLIVIGVMIGNICTAVTDLVTTFAQDADIVDLHAWNMGSFSAVSWDGIRAVTWAIVPGLLMTFLLSKPIGALRLGEDYAQSLGVNVRRFRVVLILLSSLLSACVTALTGPISFVGVAVPHMTGLLFGTSEPLVILPGSFLLGGVFCLFCDLLARTVFAPTELAIGTVTAVFGAPVVIAMMLSRGRKHV